MTKSLEIGRESQKTWLAEKFTRAADRGEKKGHLESCGFDPGSRWKTDRPIARTREAITIMLTPSYSNQINRVVEGAQSGRKRLSQLPGTSRHTKRAGLSTGIFEYASKDQSRFSAP